MLLSGCLQHLVDSCLGCIAAKGNVGLAEILIFHSISLYILSLFRYNSFRVKNNNLCVLEVLP